MKATVDKALIQQAIEALEIGDQFNPGLARVVLRAAPAEPAVEPDGSIKVWVLVDKDGNPQKWRAPCFVGPESDTQLECFDRVQPDRAPHKSVMLAAPPPPAEPAVELSITKHQANLVAHALAECINAAGICPYKESDFSVHELLLYAGDLKRKLVAVKRMLEAAVRLAQQN